MHEQKLAGVNETSLARRGLSAFLSVCLAVMLLPMWALPSYASQEGENLDGASDSIELRENSWRYEAGERIYSANGASTDNDGVALYGLATNSSGYKVFDSFDVFPGGYCSGVDAYCGIDVSFYQGAIDWGKVKAAGVDYAIIRTGYIGNDEHYTDTQFFQNVKGCVDNGIPFGVYVYSYVKSSGRAQSGAEYVLDLLTEAGVDPTDMKYPIYLDLEDSSTEGSDFAAIAKAFCGTVEDAGFTAGVYANKNWWETRLTDVCFNDWYIWVAQYNTSGMDCAKFGSEAKFKSMGGMWQYSDYGLVSGVSGRVDLNYTYLKPLHQCDYTVEVLECASYEKEGSARYTCSDCGYSYTDVVPRIKSTSIPYVSMTYTGTARKPAVTVKDVEGNVLTQGVDYTVAYEANTKPGRAKVTATFAGKYEGTRSLTFMVLPAAPTNVKTSLYGYDDVKVTWSKSVGAAGYTVYCKKPTDSAYIRLGTTTGTSFKKANLHDGVKYTFKVVPYMTYGGTTYNSSKYATSTIYTLKKVGTPTVTTCSTYKVKVTSSLLNVRSGSGTNYTVIDRLKKGDVVTIVRTKNGWGELKTGGWVKLSSTKKTGSTSTQVKVKWTNINGESGYQVSRSTSKTGTNVVATVTSANAVNRVVSATAGKKYYYKVRAYTVVNGVKVYGPWSSVKAFTR